MWGQRVACPMRGGSDHTWAGQSAMEKIQKCLDCQIVANLSRKETKSFSLFFFFLPLQCLCHDSELWRGKRAGWRWWQMPGARMLKPRKVLAISCSACSDNRENMYYGRCIDQIFLIVILKWTFIWYDSHFRTANRQRCHLCIFPNKVRSLQKGYLAVKACLVGGLSQAAAPRQQSEPQADEIDGLKCCRAQAANGRLKPNMP